MGLGSPLPWDVTMDHLKTFFPLQREMQVSGDQADLVVKLLVDQPPQLRPTFQCSLGRCQVLPHVGRGHTAAVHSDGVPSVGFARSLLDPKHYTSSRAS